MHHEDKARLRSELSAARAARTAPAIEHERADVRDAVLVHSAASGWRCVTAYVAMRTEPGSPELLDGLVAQGARVLVPLLRPDRDLDWAEWDPQTGEPGTPLGAEAIASADAVLVPALAVALDGTRLGRGGGSYDRALSRAREGVPIAALLYDGELVDELPRDSWDRPVTAVVTPTGWRDLRT